MDSLGLPLTVVVHSAGVSDQAGARVVLLRLAAQGVARVQTVIADGGYAGERLRTWTSTMFQWTLQIVKRPEVPRCVVLPKRWIVERTFAWLEKGRRRWKNCERYLNTSLQMMNLAFLVLVLRRLEKNFE